MHLSCFCFGMMNTLEEYIKTRKKMLIAQNDIYLRQLHLVMHINLMLLREPTFCIIILIQT